MNKFIIINNEESVIKNIFITDDNIKSLDKNLKSEENFIKSFQSECNGALDIKEEIKYNQIQSLSTFNDDFGIQLIYLKRDGKKETTFYEFDSSEQKDEIKQFILKKTHLMKIDSKSEAKKNITNRRIVFLIITILMASVYLTIVLPKFSLYIMISIFIGVGYWVQLGQTKQEIIEDVYSK